MIVCHTPVFIILMLGLIVSATALSVYYAQSAAMANTLTAFTLSLIHISEPTRP